MIYTRTAQNDILRTVWIMHVPYIPGWIFMSEAQECIDALRKKDYFKALRLTHLIYNKYEKINLQDQKAHLPLGNDELQQLIIYELCKTDINKEDIDAINFLYNYINYHENLSTGKVGFEITSLLTSASITLEIKENKNYSRVIEAFDIEDSKSIARFIDTSSSFSQFIEQIMHQAQKNSPSMLEMLSKELDENALLKKIMDMDNLSFANFQNDIQLMKIEERIPGLHCPLIKYRVQKELLIRSIGQYKAHLVKKLEKEKSDFLKEENEMLSPLAAHETYQSEPIKTRKLRARYDAIQFLEIETTDILKKSDLERIREAMSICQMCRPNWEERAPLQKITDVLSIGLKPLIRVLTSKESQFTSQIEEAVEQINISP